MNGEGLCNRLVVAERTQREGTNENGSMFVHAYALYSCLSPGSRKHINSSQPLIFIRFLGDLELSPANTSFLLQL